MADRILATGKLPANLLAALLERATPRDPRVILGPSIGQDAAVIEFSAGSGQARGDHYLVAKTDPITFATDAIGWYAVNVNANDIACMGARPKWFMASVLLSEGSASAAMAETIFSQIIGACAELGITLVGGHTEITHDLSRPLVIGAMLGEVAKDKLVTSAGIRMGDSVVLTKAVPLEGTALIAREKEDDLRARGFSDEFIARTKGLLCAPGISVVREALLAAEAGLATAMHDPTEGGLATGLWELAQAGRVGLTIDADAIPILADGLAMCAAYGLDPLGVIASGALLITTPAAERLCDLLTRANIPSARIGRVVSLDEGLTLIRGGARQPFPRFEVDEIARLFG